MNRNLALFLSLTVALMTLSACQKSNLDSLHQNQHLFGIVNGELVRAQDLNEATVGLFSPEGASCTGEYLGDHKILSAAHCLVEDAYTLTRASFNLKDGVVSCEIMKRVLHPDYLSKSEDTHSDIAVGFIKCSPEVDQKISQIKPYKLSTKTTSIEGAQSAGYGFKSLKLSGYSVFPELYQIAAKTIDLTQEQVKKNIGEEYETLKKKINSGSLNCFEASAEKTVIFGDSGGPTYVRNGEDLEVLSVLSFISTVGFDQTEESLKRIFMSCATNVAYYRDWIEKQTAE